MDCKRTFCSRDCFAKHKAVKSKQHKSICQLVYNCGKCNFRIVGNKKKIKVLANQLQAPHMIHAFNDATSIPHGYLLVDLKPNTPDYLRFRTHIFQNWFTKADQQGPVVYSPGV